MTVEDIQRVLDLIEAKKDDPEAAHSLQDDLWQLVLECVANGAENSALLAKEALKVLHIDFERWCA